MNPIEIAQHAGAHPLPFLAAALLLGALHGLEPGHSKGLMAAFIIGARGTYAQAVVLALCATLSHTAIVWILAVPASYGGTWWSDAQIGPYLNLISGIVVLALAAWMLFRLNRGHGNSHHHEQAHHPDHDHGHPHEHSASAEDDGHARHHMREVAGRFSGHHVSIGQVAIFGLSSGLAPCSAAVVVLVTCFRMHQPWLGLALVAAFSVGLGATLTAVALAAAWGLRTVGAHSRRLDELAQKAPYLSAGVTAAVGIFLIVEFFRSF